MEHSAKLGINLNRTYSKALETPLMIACQKGHKSVVEKLLAFAQSNPKALDLNAQSKTREYTAFHVACENGMTSAVEQMLEFAKTNPGILNLTIKDRDGKTGYQFAKDNKRFDVVNLIKEKMPSLAKKSFW